MQTDIVFGDKDIQHLFKYLLEQGAKFVPDIRYTSPRYQELDTLKAIMASRQMSKFLFVVHHCYTRYPLEMRRFKNHTDYYIVQRNGGPSLDLFCPGLISQTGKSILGQGFIGCYPTFWNPVSEHNEKSPSELLAFYHDAVRWIKRVSIRKTTKKRIFYVGQEAHNLIMRGCPSNQMMRQ
jgi:hypothetical protein